jgi:hypothetical protein
MWPRWFARLLLWAGVNLFGGQAARKVYRDSRHGKLSPETIAIPGNDQYHISAALSKEFSNITVTIATNDEISLIEQIESNLNSGVLYGENLKGEIKGGWRSLAVVIGHMDNLSWYGAVDEEGVVSISIFITDSFNFEEQHNFRTNAAEGLTRIGRDAELQETIIKARFDLIFKKNTEGQYELLE